jgi:hypothetical protein
MKKETGGSAFPRSLYTQGGAFDSSSLSQGYGMTLRDYFAAKAMQAVITSGAVPTGIMIDTAKEAYQMADAMLKARQQ